MQYIVVSNAVLMRDYCMNNLQQKIVRDINYKYSVIKTHIKVYKHINNITEIFTLFPHVLYCISLFCEPSKTYNSI